MAGGNRANFLREKSPMLMGVLWIWNGERGLTRKRGVRVQNAKSNAGISPLHRTIKLSSFGRDDAVLLDVVSLFRLSFEVQLQLDIGAGHDQHTVFDGELFCAEVCFADVVGLKPNGDQMATCAGDRDGLADDGIDGNLRNDELWQLLARQRDLAVVADLDHVRLRIRAEVEIVEEVDVLFGTFHDRAAAELEPQTTTRIGLITHHDEARRLYGRQSGEKDSAVFELPSPLGDFVHGTVSELIAEVTVGLELQ